MKLARQRQYGRKSEQSRNVLQMDLLADEAESLADGEPDSDDGEIEADEKTPIKPRRKRQRKGFSPNLPRVQRYEHLTEAEREGAIDAFFVKVKEELDIIPAQVQVIEVMREKAVYLDQDGERCLRAARHTRLGVASLRSTCWPGWRCRNTQTACRCIDRSRFSSDTG